MEHSVVSVNHEYFIFSVDQHHVPVGGESEPEFSCTYKQSSLAGQCVFHWDFRSRVAGQLTTCLILPEQFGRSHIFYSAGSVSDVLEKYKKYMG